MSTPVSNVNNDSAAAPASESLLIAQDVNEADSMPWAIVLVGRQPGVFFKGGEEIMANVHSIPGSIVIKYHTEEEARNAYTTALATYKVVRITLEHTRTVVVESAQEPLTISGPQLGVRTWHVVFVGREPGVFPDKSQILENTNHVPGCRSQKYEDYDLAVQDFRDCVSIKKAIRVHWKLTRELLLPGSE